MAGGSPQGKRPGYRPDKEGAHRTQFEKNKRSILASQDVCGICGKPVDKSLRYPHPMSATIDHVIPVAKGGHPSAIENLQLAHFCCNRAKSDKLNLNSETSSAQKEAAALQGNRDLPQSRDWTTYRG